MQGPVSDADTLIPGRWPGWYLLLAAAAIYIALLGAYGAFIAHYSFNWGHIDDFLLIDWHRRAFVLHTMSLGQFLTIADNSHLLAAEALASWVLFAIFGLSFKVLVYFSASLLLAGAVLLTSLLWPGLSTPAGRSLALLLPLLVLFHPVQIHQLLWAFEIGWFMVDFWLVANVFLLERYGQRGLPIVAGLCVLASFSSAHGNFLWLAAALHVSLRPDLRHRGTWCGVLCTGFLAGIVAISMFTYPESGGIRDGGIHIADGWRILTYFIGLFGSVFGSRDPVALAVLGGSMITLTIGAGWYAWRKPALRPGDRAGIVLVAASVMFVAAFAIGRFRFGLPWALAEYHAGPLPVPLLCGLCLLAIEAFDDPRRAAPIARGIVLLPGAFVLASLAAFLPYALSYGREQLVLRSLAMHESCHPGMSPLISARLNGLQNNAVLMDRTLPIALRLCTDDEPKITRRFEAEPALFVALSGAHPEAASALHDLWGSYLTHLDLMRAMPIDALGTPGALLTFAHFDALGGSQYDPQLLARDRASFIRMNLPR